MIIILLKVHRVKLLFVKNLKINLDKKLINKIDVLIYNLLLLLVLILKVKGVKLQPNRKLINLLTMDEQLSINLLKKIILKEIIISKIELVVNINKNSIKV